MPAWTPAGSGLGAPPPMRPFFAKDSIPQLQGTMGSGQKGRIIHGGTRCTRNTLKSFHPRDNTASHEWLARFVDEDIETKTQGRMAHGVMEPGADTCPA